MKSHFNEIKKKQLYQGLKWTPEFLVFVLNIFSLQGLKNMVSVNNFELEKFSKHWNLPEKGNRCKITSILHNYSQNKNIV